MNIPTKTDIKEAFNTLKDTCLNDIPGIMCFDTGNPGPLLGITVFTHGNEPSGTAVLSYFLQNNIPQQLSNGSVIFVLNNIKAAEKYFNAQSKEEKRQSRFIDINFNRLPLDSLKAESDERYEIQRLREIYPILEQFDVGFDIHSTENYTPPIIIRGKKDDPELIKGFPMENIITDIDKVQIGRPIFSFYGGDEMIPTIEIEAGSHEDDTSYKNAIESTLALLKNLNMLNGDNETKMSEYTNYHIVDSLLFPNDSYKLKKELAMFESIEKGQIIGEGNAKDIVSPLTGHALMAPKGIIPSSYEEEVIFISKPKEQIIF